MSAENASGINLGFLYKQLMVTTACAAITSASEENTADATDIANEIEHNWVKEYGYYQSATILFIQIVSYPG